MSRNSGIVLCFLLALMLFSATVCMERALAKDESTAQISKFLISTIAQSHLTFIRNGEEHTCDEAAGHIKKKYDYFLSKIKTPEDFICLCASKSVLSGRPYLVVTEQGTIPMAKWLEQKLTEYMKDKNHS